MHLAFGNLAIATARWAAPALQADLEIAGLQASSAEQAYFGHWSRPVAARLRAVWLQPSDEGFVLDRATACRACRSIKNTGNKRGCLQRRRVRQSTSSQLAQQMPSRYDEFLCFETSEEGAMIRIRRPLLAQIALVFFSSLLLAQSPEATPQETQQAAPQRTAEQRDAYRKAMEEADRKIADEVNAHSELVKNLEYLTTQIGPRLTGSPQMQAASNWTLKRFRDYGVDAHLETAEIAHAWTRGLETAEITSPVQKRVGIRALGWSRATNGEISGNVVLLDLKNPSDFDQYKGRLKGAIVMKRKPVDMSEEEANPENAYDAVIPPPRGIPEPNGGFRGRMRIISQISAEQPALILMDSGKTDSLYDMTGGFRRYSASEVPMAFLTHEDYDLLYRLLQAGPVTMKANLPETFSEKPVPASITVAEIKGSEHPDE